MDAELPVRMLHDRVLVMPDSSAGERHSGGGLVIPATASLGKRLAWGMVRATGHHVRQVAVGERALYDPEDKAEVELEGTVYVLLRERDLHAVSHRDDADRPGMYL